MILTETIKVARHYECIGQWDKAAKAWKDHIKKSDPTGAQHLSDTIEYAYAMIKAFEYMGVQSPIEQRGVKELINKIRAAVLKGDAFFSDRPACFKGFDLLAMASEQKLIPMFLYLLGANLDEDEELRSKFLTEFSGDRDTHQWVWNDNITRQRISVFNEVVLDYCARNSTREHISLFFSIKRYAAKCLAQARTPSIKEIRHIVSSDNASLKNFEPVFVPENVPKLSAFFDHSFIDVTASLAFFHADVLRDIAANTRNEREFEHEIMSLSHLMPRYGVITKLGYPMGGGESFMHQTCAILREFGFKNIWVSFTDKYGISYKRGSVTQTPYYLDVRLEGGLCDHAVAKAIVDYGMDIVHSQGISNEIVAKCASDLRVPCLVGFHFWSGLVRLGFTSNRKIMENLELHEVEDVVKPDRNTVRYVASEFMYDVYRAVAGADHLEVFHPVPDPSHYGVTNTEREGARFVTQINLAEHKGGRIFLACVEKLGHEGIPFLGVQGEPVEQGLLSEITKAVSNSPGSCLESYGPAQSIYARSKIVIVPTLVDETFCRVAFEAAANGIPVLSTCAGFIPYMLGDTGIYLPDDDPNVWIEMIRELYADSKRISEIGRRQQEHVLKKFGKYPAAFLDATLSIASSNITRKNIGFFTTWSDQRLGYQARHYSHLLREAGYRTHIFSFLPYKALGKGLKIQRNEGDWAIPHHADSVYYSYNDREHVPASEIEQFIRANRVGTLVYPEICWDVNWRMVEQISVPNLFIAGVPNLETVRKGEAQRHESVLSLTLCPTRAVEQILYSHGVRNTRYIGHGFGKPLTDADITEKIGRLQEREVIHFLHVGRHNPKSRKQTPLVIEAFQLALEQRSDIHLTVTLMDTQNIDLPVHKNIRYIGSLGHDEVLDLYKACDVSIQVSSHEGIGMGFYESLAMGTPVISLDVPPHNEVVLHGLTGWLLQADLVPLPDNDDPISRAARFNTQDLADLITSLEKEEIAAMIRTAAKIYNERFSDRSLKLRLLKALP